MKTQFKNANKTNTESGTRITTNITVGTRTNHMRALACLMTLYGVNLFKKLSRCERTV